MGIFHSIKKSRRASSDIDEKIEYLNKELVKTGLHEMMTTDKVYQSGNEVTNTDFNNFQGLSVNGLKLGISGADGNGAGDAYVGTIETGMRLAGSYVGLKGAAISPPHPVTGVRNVATTQTGFAGFFSPLLPGQIQRSGNTPSGGALWYWDPNHNNGEGVPQGQWFNLEWVPSQNSWAFWDTNFLGFFFLNRNLDDLVLSGNNIGTEIKNAIAGINFGSNGSIGTPKTLVLTQNRLDDVSFLPINIDGLSPQGYNYLKDKSRRKKEEGEKTYSVRSSMRPVTTTTSSQTQQTPPSTQTQQTPPSSTPPPSDFDLDVELTPDNIPDEFKADDSEKPSAQGVTLTKWMSRTDFMKNYPDSTMEEYLSALPYGATNFMKPDPNFPGARIVDTDAYERYFLTGDTSGVSGKPKHSRATPEPEQKKWGGKTKEQIIADLEADSAKYSAEEKAAKEEMQRIALELGMDFVSLIGGLFTGGTTAAPVLGKLGMKLLKKYGKTVAGKMLRKLLKKFRNKKNSKQLDELLDDIDNAEAQEYDPRKPFEPDAGDQYPNLTRKGEQTYDTATERLLNQRQLGGPDGDLAGRLLDDLVAAAPKGDAALNSVMNKIKKSPIGYLFNSYKPDGKLLSEAAKLGHFEPEALTVDIEDLRKGIVPEFPKDPPPEMVDGYNPKSRLAPKKLERTSFIKITKKDLAKNHRLKDSEIKDFMDQINAINEFIKKHPEELIYAQTRYPKSDPRLAQLNWQMDQKLNASKEYMDKHYPENQKLFTKIQKSIKKNIELTDPKSFKGVKIPKFEGVDLTDHKRRKAVVSRHYKKAVKIRKLFSRKKT